MQLANVLHIGGPDDGVESLGLSAGYEMPDENFLLTGFVAFPRGRFAEMQKRHAARTRFLRNHPDCPRGCALCDVRIGAKRASADLLQ